ncbi:MAG: CDP-glycerol glycerophosphotransferase family protein [Anaerolineales bacterium]|nr:CDP-glycerol glycerophosphotransferase family protein [Anaerolineales bacterium]
MTKQIFISADHGLAIVYFLQSDVLATLLEDGNEVVLLTDDALIEQIETRFGQPGLTVEGLRLEAARQYADQHKASQQFWADFLRRAGASNKINLEAVDSYIYQVEGEAGSRRKRLFPLMMAAVAVLRRSKLARRLLVRFQRRFNPNLYTDLFEKYQPDLVITSTPGWRYDRYLLREAAARGIPTVSVIVGWDNSSSYSLPGADVDWITCWSDIQKDELMHGSDWEQARINVGGIPSYDGYFDKRWLMGREEYFKLHGLDPARKLISYASSFITFSPNIQNVEALAELVSGDELAEPSQLLVRLHPNHFMDVERFAAEREQIRALARELPHVHVVEPVPLGGHLGHYSGEDMPEKTSMMAHSDVFVTVYSTMVVEASIHDRPVVSACIDSPVGWPDKFTLPLSQIGGWPTHSRFRQSGAGRVALTKPELRDALNYYLENPGADLDARRAFIQRECAYTDGSAGRRTGAYLKSLLDKSL